MTRASCNGSNNDDSDWIEEYVSYDLLKVVDWFLQTDHTKC
jgi:hypothetical protein